MATIKFIIPHKLAERALAENIVIKLPDQTHALDVGIYIGMWLAIQGIYRESWSVWVEDEHISLQMETDEIVNPEAFQLSLEEYFRELFDVQWEMAHE